MIGEQGCGEGVEVSGGGSGLMRGAHTHTHTHTAGQCRGTRSCG